MIESAVSHSEHTGPGPSSRLVTILEEPVDKPWGERVARVADPDGNDVIIGARGETASDG